MNRIRTFLIFLCCLVSLISCKEDPTTSQKNEQHSNDEIFPSSFEVLNDGIVKVTGATMGTYYNIRYVGEPIITQESIDSIFEAINMEVSTWIPNSLISTVNTSEELVYHIKKDEYPHFYKNYIRSYKMASLTTGRFDPTIAPLVNFWGFGYDKEAFAQKDTSKIPELLELVGFYKWQHHIEDDSTLVFRKIKDAIIDFSGIAKGHAVDVVAEYCASKGISNHFVDIGGEVRASGQKLGGKPWLIGVNVPLEDAALDEAIAYMPVKDFSVATSGSYRNFYEENGEKFSHIILPWTGMPAKSDILSVSVVHKDCIIADAAATVLLLSGIERSRKILEHQKTLSGYVVYVDENGDMQTWQSSDFPVEIINNN